MRENIKGYASYDLENIRNIQRTETQYRMLLNMYNYNKQEANYRYAKAPKCAYITQSKQAKIPKLFLIKYQVKGVFELLKKRALSLTSN